MDPVNFLIIVAVLLIILCIFNTFGQPRAAIAAAFTTIIAIHLLTLFVLLSIAILHNNWHK